MKFGDLNIEISDNILKFGGNFTYKSGKNSIEFIAKNITQNSMLDFSNLDEIDYASAILLNKVIAKFNLKITNANERVARVIEFCAVINRQIIPPKRPNLFSQIGKKATQSAKSALVFCAFLGEFFLKFISMLQNFRKFRIKEVSNHIADGAIYAVFIVCLTSFLVGVVLVYIGADMLSKFGATIYIVNIMGIMGLREIAPLIAAIVVAGRSASSFTAQIGVMKITDEIPAMKTMGLDPFLFLAMPRIVAMVVAMPMLIFLADMANLGGQILVCFTYLDIPISDYFSRFKDSVAISHLFVGLIKAPFYGAIIAMIGCMRGYEVQSNSQSLGKFTTISVVNAIFLVICADGFFAILFSEIGY